VKRLTFQRNQWVVMPPCAVMLEGTCYA